MTDENTPEPKPSETCADLPAWFKDWTKDRGGLNAVGFSWILTRPEAVQKILVDFPPACVVRVKTSGEYGINLGVIAGDTEFPTLRIGRDPRDKSGDERALGELEVVGYWNGLTGEVVASILDAGKVQAIVPAKDETRGSARNAPCPCGSGIKAKRCGCKNPNKGMN